ncbi:hypothetical protein [Pseudonocardia alni]|uniref:hypothetical protein n=1 Tax=Pseudonocardia alni TaxID=33907 RepID=UPI00279FDA2C|nr:hypothetical protein PaSha_25480 [Pseudonocardia alni]
MAAQRTYQQQARQVRALEDAEHRREEAERRSQAMQFSLWVSIVVEDRNQIGVRVSNANSEPFYFVTVYSMTPLAVNIIRATVGPNTRRPMPRPTRALREILSGLNHERLLEAGQIMVASTFRDARGNWWFRDSLGNLAGGDSEFDVEKACRQHVAKVTAAWSDYNV